MLKVILVAGGGFALDRRATEDSAWVPVNKDDLHLPPEITDGINSSLQVLATKNVSHFVNNGAITFFDGDHTLYVEGDVVQLLQSYAEVVEARIIVQMGNIL